VSSNESRQRVVGTAGKYMLACSMIVASFLIRLSLAPFLGDRSRYLLFIPAILVSGYYLGLGPGLLAIASAVLLTMVVVPPDLKPAYEAMSDEIGMILFLIVCVAVLIVGDRERREKQRREAAEAELDRLNQALEIRVRERTAELQLANKELEGFCYSVAHDLRTPMRAISGNARILVEDFPDQLTPVVRQKLARMEYAAGKLGKLVDGLLTYARLANQEMACESVNLSALVVDAAAAARQEFDTDVSLQCAPDLVVRGDPRMLRLAIEALVNNAVKFRKKGEPVCLEFSSGVREGVAVFELKDSGIGFEMEYLHKLFQPFERLHRDEEYPGVGMGLAQVKRVVERHGGEVWADAVLGQGSRFAFSLPQSSSAVV
jgi:signal transduction histidine kinase